MTLLGGMGTILGPIVGAAFVITLQNWLADKVGEWVSVIIGIIFLACVMAFRKGFVGESQALYRRLKAKSRTSASTAVAAMPPESTNELSIQKLGGASSPTHWGPPA